MTKETLQLANAAFERIGMKDVDGNPIRAHLDGDDIKVFHFIARVEERGYPCIVLYCYRNDIEAEEEFDDGVYALPNLAANGLVTAVCRWLADKVINDIRDMIEHENRVAEAGEVF